MSTAETLSRMLARVTALRVEFGEVEDLADDLHDPRAIELAAVVQTLLLHIAEHVQDLQAADEDGDWSAFGNVAAGV